ncbi:hypothetical protein D3C85_732070 [compost metagenome]
MCRNRHSITCSTNTCSWSTSCTNHSIDSKLISNVCVVNRTSHRGPYFDLIWPSSLDSHAICLLSYSIHNTIWKCSEDPCHLGVISIRYKSWVYCSSFSDSCNVGCNSALTKDLSVCNLKVLCITLCFGHILRVRV